MALVDRSESYKPGIFYVTVFALLWAVGLLYAGAYTTSIEAGMAFLDWPLSNSSINPEGWLTQEDMRAEHSHRLLGASLGMLSMLLVLLTQLKESRRWVRNVAWGFLAMVILQGLLGGLRVLYDNLNTGAESNLVAQIFLVLHACGAELTVCLLVTLSVACSKSWIEKKGSLAQPATHTLRKVALFATGFIFIQILMGAIMRHTPGAALAIPTFPLTPDGSLLPHAWYFSITIHWLHRLGAVFVTIAIIVLAAKVYGRYGANSRMGWIASALLGILALQIFLGAATIWTYKNPVMASSHMLVGACLLATTWMLTFLTYRLPIPSTETNTVSRELPEHRLGEKGSPSPIA